MKNIHKNNELQNQKTKATILRSNLIGDHAMHAAQPHENTPTLFLDLKLQPPQPS